MTGTGQKAENAAARAERSRGLQIAARIGFVMSGLVHLLIGWVALRLALGSSGGEEADQGGAMSSIADAPGGVVLLGVGGLGLACLGIWFLLQAWFEARRQRDTKDTVKEAVTNGAKAVVYAVLAFTALRLAFVGGSSDGDESTQSATSSVIGNPVGQVLVVIVGLVVIGVGGYHVYKGATRKFEEDLRRGPSGHASTAVVGTGIAGFVAKGVALGAVGVLLGWAGIEGESDKAAGLDGALRMMAGLPAGTILLGLVGVGLILFGIYSFFLARYADL
ncbi:MAG: DUF1206 domain-containing protein [Brachybacterium sp.]|nr:DUF1206 domain-containing protein [Brachybacterium sp.]